MRHTPSYVLTDEAEVNRLKLSQNKKPEVVERIIAALDGDGPYASKRLAAEMKLVHGDKHSASS